MPITTEFESLSGEVYSIQHYVIKFVSDLWQVGGFLRRLPFSSTNKTDLHEITEILLTVALNTITLTPEPQNKEIGPRFCIARFNPSKMRITPE